MGRPLHARPARLPDRQPRGRARAAARDLPQRRPPRHLRDPRLHRRAAAAPAGALRRGPAAVPRRGGPDRRAGGTGPSRSWSSWCGRGRRATPSSSARRCAPRWRGSRTRCRRPCATSSSSRVEAAVAGRAARGPGGRGRARPAAAPAARRRRRRPADRRAGAARRPARERRARRRGRRRGRGGGGLPAAARPDDRRRRPRAPAGRADGAAPGLRHRAGGRPGAAGCPAWTPGWRTTGSRRATCRGRWWPRSRRRAPPPACTATPRRTGTGCAPRCWPATCPALGRRGAARPASSCLEEAAEAAHLAGDHDQAVALLGERLADAADGAVRDRRQPAATVDGHRAAARPHRALPRRGRSRRRGHPRLPQGDGAAARPTPVRRAPRCCAGRRRPCCTRGSTRRRRRSRARRWRWSARSGRPARRPRVLATLGFGLAYLEDTAAGSAALAEALAVAERVGGPDGRRPGLPPPRRAAVRAAERDGARDRRRPRGPGPGPGAGAGPVRRCRPALGRRRTACSGSGRWDEAAAVIGEAWALQPTGVEAMRAAPGPVQGRHEPGPPRRRRGRPRGRRRARHRHRRAPLPGSAADPARRAGDVAGPPGPRAGARRRRAGRRRARQRRRLGGRPAGLARRPRPRRARPARDARPRTPR